MSTPIAGRARHALTALLVLGVVVQCLLLYLPAQGEGHAPPGSDKVVHAVMFGGPVLLAALLGRWKVVVALAIHAPSSELVQGLPAVHRDPDVWDAVADLTGVTVALALWWCWRRRPVR